MTSWAWRCGHALYAGVIVRWTGWDDEADAGHQGRFGRGFVQRVGELFSSTGIMFPVRGLFVLLPDPAWIKIILMEY